MLATRRPSRENTLPRPKRTVRFLWVPEISGTRAYLRAHPELGQHVVASVSTDMVGANQTIKQTGLYGAAVRSYEEVGQVPGRVVEAYVRTCVDRALAAALGTLTFSE